MFEILSDDRIKQIEKEHWQKEFTFKGLEIAIATAQRDKDIREVVKNLRMKAFNMDVRCCSEVSCLESITLREVANEYEAKLGGEG